MKYIFCFLFFLFSVLANGQGSHGFQVATSLDNDFFSPAGNKDENYTGGAKLEVLIPGLRLKWMPFYRFAGANAINIQRFAFGGTAYTPQDLASSAVIRNDRPYASLTFMSIGNTSISNNGKILLQSDIIIGGIGKSGPGKVQSYIHRHHWFGTQRPDPMGWQNQIGYNGSLVINYNSRLQKYLFSTSLRDNMSFQWMQGSLVGKVDIGNYMINLQSGIKFNLINYNSTVLQEYTPEPQVLLTGAQPITAPNKSFRFNLFVEPHVRLAAYNATLEGLMFGDNSISKIPHNEVKRFLFEINAGVNLTLWDILYLRYSFYGRSREFIGGKAFHTWGGITLGISNRRWFRH